MKLKIRIATTIMSMTLALGVMVFAVWAAATQTLNVTNTVSFVSNHVLATVTGSVQGAEAGLGSVDLFYESITTSPTVNQNDLTPWEIGDIGFENENEPINIFILIQNNSLERYFTFELAFAEANISENTNMSRVVNHFDGYTIENPSEILINDYIADYNNGAEQVALQPYAENQKVTIELNTSKIVVVTLEIVDTGKSVTNFNNNFSVKLLNKGEEGLSDGFVFNKQNQTITVPAGQTLTKETLPEMIMDGQAAYFGLFSNQSAEQQQRVHLPHTSPADSESVLYAKFGEIPSYLEFTLINEGTEYAVTANETKFGQVLINEETYNIIEIPEYVNGIPVTTISDNAGFEVYSQIHYLIIPSTIRYIGENSFSFYYLLNNLFLNCYEFDNDPMLSGLFNGFLATDIYLAKQLDWEIFEPDYYEGGVSEYVYLFESYEPDGMRDLDGHRGESMNDMGGWYDASKYNTEKHILFGSYYSRSNFDWLRSGYVGDNYYSYFYIWNDVSQEVITTQTVQNSINYEEPVFINIFDEATQTPQNYLKNYYQTINENLIYERFDLWNDVKGDYEEFARNVIEIDNELGTDTYQLQFYNEITEEWEFLVHNGYQEATLTVAAEVGGMYYYRWVLNEENANLVWLGIYDGWDDEIETQDFETYREKEINVGGTPIYYSSYYPVSSEENIEYPTYIKWRYVGMPS